MFANLAFIVILAPSSPFGTTKSLVPNVNVCVSDVNAGFVKVFNNVVPLYNEIEVKSAADEEAVVIDRPRSVTAISSFTARNLSTPIVASSPDVYHVSNGDDVSSDAVNVPAPTIVKVAPAVVFKVSVIDFPVLAPVTVQSGEPAEKSNVNCVVAVGVEEAFTLPLNSTIICPPFATVNALLSIVNDRFASAAPVLPEGLLMFDPVVNALLEPFVTSNNCRLFTSSRSAFVPVIPLI